MPRIEPFEQFYMRYEQWFIKHKFVYLSELNAIKKVLPTGEGIEIGVGTGRFAIPFDIRYGVEPSLKMGFIARQRGINVIQAVAEALPIKSSSFDFATMITTVCFVDNLKKSFEEVWRILKPNGYIILGYIDKNSPLGQFYSRNKNKNPFYRYATFYSTEELITLLKNVGFGDFVFYQTIFKPLDKINSIEPLKKGYGEGSFIALRGKKLF